MSKTAKIDHVPNKVPPQPGECRDAVHWFVDSVGLYQGSARGLILSDYSDEQEALIESAVINFKSRGVSTMVIAGDMLYKQADYLYQHAASQSPFGRPLLSKLELDMLDSDVLIIKDLVAPETPQQLWYFYHHLLYPRALAQKPLLITTPLGLDEFLSYGSDCDDLEYAGRKVTWEKAAWLIDGMMIDLHHFRMLKAENLPPMLKVEYFLYKAVVSRGLNLLPQHVLGDYMVDFALMQRGNKLAIECDLLACLDNQNSRSADATRTLVLLSDGWKLLRFTTMDLLANLMDCVDAIADVWVTGLKKSPAGRLVTGQTASPFLDLPVEDDVERLAITNGAGPVAVTGGAGTGKSTCVVRRVAHLLSQGVNPERILVISHSTESAGGLRQALEPLMDKATAARVSFFSWNELGLKLLKENTGAIKRKPPLKVEGNPQRVIQRLLTKYKKDLDQLTLELSEELEEFTIASLISLYKANLITPKHVKERAKTNVDELVARVFLGYEEQLQKSNKIDRDDMVTLAAQLLADHADIRARYQYQYEFVLVDEFQDTTAAADLLVRILALPQDNLFIAGDEDECIYESKGALPRILSEVSLRLPNARCYVLENNWRSQPEIVDLARRLLLGLQRRRINKDMVPGWEASGERTVIGPQLAENEAAEAEWVAQEIQELLVAGRNPQEIAILYRYNRNASLVEEALFRKGIKCLTTNPDSTMVPDEVADVMSFLRLVMDPDGPKARESFERVCQLRSREIDPKLFNTIASFAEANNLSFLKAVEIYSEAVADQSCQDLGQLLLIIRTMNQENLPPAETIALLRRTQRLNEYYKSVKVPPGVNYEPMRKLSQLEEEARKYKTVSEFVRSQTTQKSADGQSDPLVYILSLHEAKGKEYPVVFLTGMAEGLFPSESAGDVEEERRLCYLGMTRAKDLLYVSYPGKFNEVVLAPSRFLLETMQDSTPHPVTINAAPVVVPQAQQMATGQHAAQSMTGGQKPVAGQQQATGQHAALGQPGQNQPNIDQAAAARQKAAQEAALKAQQEAALKAQQEAAIKAQQEAALKAQQEAALKAQQEAAMRAQQEAAMRAQQEAAIKAQQEAALRAQQEAALKAQQEAMALKAQQEAELQAQQEAAARAQEAALRAQQEAALKAQQEAILQAQQEALLQAQQAAALQAQQEAALQAQREAAIIAQQEAEARARHEAELLAQREAELREAQEAALRREQQAAIRAQQEAMMKAQQEAIAQAQKEALEQAQEAAVAETQQLAYLQAQKEAMARAQQEAAAKAQQMALMRAQQEAAMKVQQEAVMQAEQMAAMQAQQQAMLKAQQEAAAQAQYMAQMQLEQEALIRAQQEAALRAQQEAEMRAQQQAAMQAQQMEAMRIQQEQKLKEQQETALREQQEAALRAQQEAAMLAQQQALQAEQARQAQIAEQLELIRQAEIAQQQEAARNAELAKQAELAREAAAKVQAELEETQQAAREEAARQEAAREQAAQEEARKESGKGKGKKGKKGQTKEQDIRDAESAAAVVAGMPPQSAQPADAAAFNPPPGLPPAKTTVTPVIGGSAYIPAAAAGAFDPASGESVNPVQARVNAVSENAFWESVNGAMAGDVSAAPAGGVPQGLYPLSAPAAPGAPLPVPAPAMPTPVLPGSIACPGCQESLAPGSRFCGECGYRLETRIIACHLCGAPLDPDAKFCGECGSKLHDAKAHPSVPDAPVASGAMSTYEDYLSGQKPSQAAWVTKLKKILD
ncbi:MAG: UvrD-helicase domain-containing protein [Candidatus Obscuribacter sp.]|nr:UvrD-helicase domain-containing protein [Candidatus Obscuribacter sp.]